MAILQKVKKIKRAKNKAEPVTRPTVSIMTEVSQEQIILAAMMADRTVMRDLAISLKPDVFLGKRHRSIFRVLQRLAVKGLSYSLEAFESESSFNGSCGGRKYLDGIREAYKTPLVNLDFHLDRLHLASLKSKLRVGDAQQLLDLCTDPSTELDTLSEKLKSIGRQLEGFGVQNLVSGEDLEKKYLSDLYGRRELGGYVPTGFPELDNSLTEGLAAKRLSVWTARPSIGKSTWAWNMALRLSTVYHIPVVYFALEMSTEAVLDGMVSALSGIRLDKLIKTPQDLNSVDIGKVKRTIRELTNDGLLAIWDKSITLEKAARIIREGRFKVAIWDLWEKIVRDKKADVISSELDRTQQLAKDTDCHMALIHQTRRGVEKRKNKRPTLEDLKNSGGYEEVADLVVALYRESYYRPNVDQDILEVGILKQRRGARQGWHFFKFEGAYGRIGDSTPWDPNFES